MMLPTRGRCRTLNHPPNDAGSYKPRQRKAQPTMAGCRRGLVPPSGPDHGDDQRSTRATSAGSRLARWRRPYCSRRRATTRWHGEQQRQRRQRARRRRPAPDPKIIGKSATRGGRARSVGLMMSRALTTPDTAIGLASSTMASIWRVLAAVWIARVTQLTTMPDGRQVRKMMLV